jgi:hypothetical protein
LGLTPVRAFLFCFTNLPKPGKTNSPSQSRLFFSPDAPESVGVIGTDRFSWSFSRERYSLSVSACLPCSSSTPARLHWVLSVSGCSAPRTFSRGVNTARAFRFRPQRNCPDYCRPVLRVFCCLWATSRMACLLIRSCSIASLSPRASAS